MKLGVVSNVCVTGKGSVVKLNFDIPLVHKASFSTNELFTKNASSADLSKPIRLPFLYEARFDSERYDTVDLRRVLRQSQGVAKPAFFCTAFGSYFEDLWIPK